VDAWPFRNASKPKYELDGLSRGLALRFVFKNPESGDSITHTRVRHVEAPL
jgi:hypothetical protein